MQSARKHTNHVVSPSILVRGAWNPFYPRYISDAHEIPLERVDSGDYECDCKNLAHYHRWVSLTRNLTS
jgi:hypothetical protein